MPPPGIPLVAIASDAWLGLPRTDALRHDAGSHVLALIRALALMLLALELLIRVGAQGPLDGVFAEDFYRRPKEMHVRLVGIMLHDLLLGCTPSLSRPSPTALHIL